MIRTAFDDQTTYEVEFEEMEIEMPDLWAERISLAILGCLWTAIWWTVKFIAIKILWKLTLYFWKGAVKTMENLWQSFVKAVGEAFGRVIGFTVALLVVAAFTMSFTANGYSLSKTFSWEGLVTLYKTFK